MDKLHELFNQQEITTIFKHLLTMLIVKCPRPWKVESDRGYYIEDAKKQDVTSQGIDPNQAEKLIQMTRRGYVIKRNILTDAEVVTLFGRLFDDARMYHPLPWEIADSGGLHIISGKGTIAIDPGLDQALLEKLILLAIECAKEGNVINEEIEKDLELEPGMLGREVIP